MNPVLKGCQDFGSALLSVRQQVDDPQHLIKVSGTETWQRTQIVSDEKI